MRLERLHVRGERGSELERSLLGGSPMGGEFDPSALPLPVAAAVEETPGSSALSELERGARGEKGAGVLPLREWAALAEAWRITQALRDHRGNRSAAARALGIGRRTLYTKIDRLGLELSWIVS